jgi:predicted lipid-binding transport protein (Tim44 family)
MRVPPVNDRIKEVPAQALRGVFAGIGQLLLITDKLRNKTPADTRVPQTRTPDRAETAASTTVSEPVPAEPVAEPAQAAPAPVPAEAPVPAAPAEGGAEGAPPLPNYDELSVASLRARLRNLDVAQVRELAEYERAHAARADVIAMFERRIVKLEAEG